MYSMVLMMAMSASPEAAAAHGGCGGCDGYVVASCHGCKGGGLFGGKHGNGCCGGGGLFAGKHSNGCCGGGGMFSGKHGNGCCGGGGLFAGKHGGNGCCGGGFFGGGKHGHGCNGGCTGYVPAGCNGCIGGGVVPPPPPPPPVDKKDMPKKGGVTSAPAYITVNVPADATITIDGAATKSTSAVRVFATPELDAGTVYYYTISATVIRDGKELVATEKVAVEAGAAPQLSLVPGTTPEVASK